MRLLFALSLCAALAPLAGCALDGVEAAQVRPASEPVPPVQVTAHELHRMFPEQKARAVQSELPPQF